MRKLRAAAVFAGYLGAVIWLTWPLGARIATRLPDSHGACRFDLLATASILATESRNFWEGRHPLSGSAYYPEPHPIAYAHLALGALPVFGPVFLATGNPALAANLLFLLGVAATATSLHLVVEHWTGAPLAGLVAASVFLTDRWVLWEFVPTAPFYALLLWLPPIVALAARPADGWRWTVALAGLVFLQAATDQIYLAPAAIAPLVVLALLRALRPATRADALRLARALAIVLVALAPLYAPYLALRAAEPQLAEQSVWRPNPAPLPLDRALWGHQSPASIAPVAALLIVAGLALHLARGGRVTPRRAWTACATFVVVGALLGLPRALAVAGVTVDLAWYDWLPPLRLLRGPERLAVAALIGLALAAGLALVECADAMATVLRRGRLSAARAALAIAVVALSYRQYQVGFGRPAFERRPLPDAYPLQPAPAADDAVVHALSASGGPVLELPLGPLDVLPPFHARAMYRAIFHRRPILNGYSSYYPAGFPERMALAARLPDPAALAELRRTTGLAHVVVQTDEILDPAARSAWLAIAERGGSSDLALVARDGGTLVLAVRDPAATASP